jgi:ubiquinone/menaquinone biosynthesis C-methylase UbiE
MNQLFDQARARFFDSLAGTWDMGSIPNDNEIEGFLRKLNITSGDVVLDVGTGTGLLVPYLMKYAPEKVIALDISAKMLQKLADKYQKNYGTKLEILHNDVHCLNYGGGLVDVAICNGVFPHFHDKHKALTELYRVLKPGGRLTIHHFTSKKRINSIHASSVCEVIRGDILEDIQDLVSLVKKLGFIVHETIDSDKEFFLLATKP